MTPIIGRKFVNHETAATYFDLLVNVLEQEGGDHAQECPYYAQCNAPSCPLVASQYRTLEGEPTCAFSS